MILIYVMAWVPMVLLAIFNGMVREYFFAQKLSELHAHQLSTVTLIVFLGIYIWTLSQFWRLTSSEQAFKIGLLWLGLTVSFEFLFGHYVMRHSWDKLLQDYNVFAGRIWGLVLVWIVVAPCLFLQRHN